LVCVVLVTSWLTVQGNTALLQLVNMGCMQDFEPGKPSDMCHSDLCRYNLHQLACPLLQQVKYRGLTCYHREDWLERCMGHSKQRTKGKITTVPAHVTVANELDAAAVMRAALELGTEFRGVDAASNIELPDHAAELLFYSAQVSKAMIEAASTAQTGQPKGTPQAGPLSAGVRCRGCCGLAW